MRYTLRQLEVFLATAHFQNVTKAAESLSLSQSAASGALKDLERQFDVQLFDRVGKRLQANEFGKRLRVKAEALLSQAQALESELARNQNIGTIKVGATLTIGNYLCVDLINHYIEGGSDAKVNLEVANTETIFNEILNFDIDLGLIEGEYHHPDIEAIPWQDDQLQCFCSPQHPLAKLGTLNDTALLDANWILREHGSGTRQTFDRAMHGLLPELNITLELQHTEAIKRAVEKGLGISCLSEITLEDAFSRGSLVPLKVPSRDLSRKLYCVIHKQKYLGAGIRHWMTICGLTPPR
ncbi:MAG: LysR family transcriptional regulator [Alteromonadaceae bacterium]|nr:MAG: LysR family transcriptional regulator [Alteromonadaceae bacterium]